MKDGALGAAPAPLPPAVPALDLPEIYGPPAPISTEEGF